MARLVGMLEAGERGQFADLQWLYYFKDAVGFLWSGFFRGFSHLEKHFGDDGLVVRLEPVEQWFWVRDGMFNQCRSPGVML